MILKLKGLIATRTAEIAELGADIKSNLEEQALHILIISSYNSSYSYSYTILPIPIIIIIIHIPSYSRLEQAMPRASLLYYAIFARYYTCYAMPRAG